MEIKLIHKCDQNYQKTMSTLLLNNRIILEIQWQAMEQRERERERERPAAGVLSSSVAEMYTLELSQSNRTSWTLMEDTLRISANLIWALIFI